MCVAAAPLLPAACGRAPIDEAFPPCVVCCSCADPGYSASAKAVPSCWNNSLGLIAQHAALIDELELSAGFTITNVSNGLIDLDRDGSEWGAGYRDRPLEWLPHYVPALQSVVKPGTKIHVPFFLCASSCALAFGCPTLPFVWWRWCG